MKYAADDEYRGKGREAATERGAATGDAE